MFFQPQKVLVLVCHPDDETILCFGTLAKMVAAGAQATVAFFTDGHQDRLQCSVDTCEPLGIKVRIAPGVNNQTELNWDRRLIKSVDVFLKEEQPDLIITHSPALAEHQEHHHLYRAVINSVYRAGNPKALWLGEPISRNADFRPNLFVDISEHLDKKLAALEVHNQFLPRWFLQPEIVKARCAYWGTQVPGWQNQHSPRYCEVFQVEFMRQ